MINYVKTSNLFGLIKLFGFKRAVPFWYRQNLAFDNIDKLTPLTRVFGRL